MIGLFIRPVMNMCVVAGTFFVLHGHVDDAGVRGAIAWTTGPVMMEIVRSVAARRTRERAVVQAVAATRRCGARSWRR